jgi:3-dehydro-L-gulonate-6-phosphate decarboxylase
MTDPRSTTVLSTPGLRELARSAASVNRKVQIALDTQDVPTALAALHLVSESVDVIEVGTILCLSEGMRAVAAIRAAHPDHVVLADIRIAEAGGLLSRLAFDAGADWVTVVSGAAPSSFEVVAAVAAETGGDIQVELSEGWTWDLVRRCRDLGIGQFILHRSRDAEEQGTLAWPSLDLDAISRIYDMGGRVSVTGGMTARQVREFRDLPVEIFIAGRAIYAADNPAAAAKQFSAAVADLPELTGAGSFGRAVQQ